MILDRGSADGLAKPGFVRAGNKVDLASLRAQDLLQARWWRRRESNTKLVILRQFFNQLTVRELWSHPVDVLPLGSIS